MSLQLHLDDLATNSAHAMPKSNSNLTTKCEREVRGDPRQLLIPLRIVVLYYCRLCPGSASTPRLSRPTTTSSTGFGGNGSWVWLVCLSNIPSSRPAPRRAHPLLHRQGSVFNLQGVKDMPILPQSGQLPGGSGDRRELVYGGAACLAFSGATGNFELTGVLVRTLHLGLEASRVACMVLPT